MSNVDLSIGTILIFSCPSVYDLFRQYHFFIVVFLYILLLFDYKQPLLS